MTLESVFDVEIFEFSIWSVQYRKTSSMRFSLPLIFSSLLSIAVVACISPACIGQEAAVLDVSKVDADFAVQGEYQGELMIDGNKLRIGVQVIAQGDGAIVGIGYLGGLPGDGWSGVEPRRGEGKTADGLLAFSDEAVVKVKDGTITIRDNSGILIGECKKVARKSPTLGAKPPQGAIVLFDGKSAEQFINGKLDGELLVQGVTSKQKFQSFTLHMEFMLSYMPKARGQQRGTAVATVRDDMKCRFSIRSDSKARTTNVAGSTKQRNPMSTCASRHWHGRHTTSISRLRNTTPAARRLIMLESRPSTTES